MGRCRVKALAREEVEELLRRNSTKSEGSGSTFLRRESPHSLCNVGHSRSCSTIATTTPVALCRHHEADELLRRNSPQADVDGTAFLRRACSNGPSSDSRASSHSALMTTPVAQRKHHEVEELLPRSGSRTDLDETVFLRGASSYALSSGSHSSSRSVLSTVSTPAEGSKNKQLTLLGRSQAEAGADLYADLGVEEEADELGIRAAYKRAMLEMSGPTGAASSNVAFAYEVLSNQCSRRAYDSEQRRKREHREELQVEEDGLEASICRDT